MSRKRTGLISLSIRCWRFVDNNYFKTIRRLKPSDGGPVGRRSGLNGSYLKLYISLFFVWINKRVRSYSTLNLPVIKVSHGIRAVPYSDFPQPKVTSRIPRYQAFPHKMPCRAPRRFIFKQKCLPANPNTTLFYAKCFVGLPDRSFSNKTAYPGALSQAFPRSLWITTDVDTLL